MSRKGRTPVINNALYTFDRNVRMESARNECHLSTLGISRSCNNRNSHTVMTATIFYTI